MLTIILCYTDQPIYHTINRTLTSAFQVVKVTISICLSCCDNTFCIASSYGQLHNYILMIPCSCWWCTTSWRPLCHWIDVMINSWKLESWKERRQILFYMPTCPVFRGPVTHQVYKAVISLNLPVLIHKPLSHYSS